LAQEEKDSCSFQERRKIQSCLQVGDNVQICVRDKTYKVYVSRAFRVLSLKNAVGQNLLMAVGTPPETTYRYHQQLLKAILQQKFNSFVVSPLGASERRSANSFTRVACLRPLAHFKMNLPNPPSKFDHKATHPSGKEISMKDIHAEPSWASFCVDLDTPLLPTFPFLLQVPSLFLPSSFPAIPPSPLQSPPQIRPPMVLSLLELSLQIRNRRVT
jgi:hypothetical protein